jgi:hypothetical protein
VNFDPRIWNGNLDLPGIPSVSGGSETYLVASWREVALP